MNCTNSENKGGEVCIFKSELYSLVTVCTTLIEKTGVAVKLKNRVPKVPGSNLDWMTDCLVPGLCGFR
jgi:hypothetical protein